MELHNDKAERALLGSVLIDPAAYRRVRHVPSEAFEFWKHKTLWQTIGRLFDADKPLDYVVVCDTLERDGVLEQVEASYLTDLINAVPSAVRIEHYAEIVLDYARRRNDVRLAERLAKLALNGSEPSKRAEIAHEILRGSVGETDWVDSFEAATKTWEEIESYVADPIEYGEIRDLPTGLTDLDRITGGLHQGLYAVAGSTSTGKTALALSIAVNIAMSGKRVAFVSPEMSPADLMHRIVCAYAQVDSRLIESGDLSSDELTRIHSVVGWASEMEMIMSQEERPEIIEAQVHRALPLDFIVLDGIELLTSDSSEKTHEQRGNLSRWAKQLADHRDVQCPVWLSMQVSSKELKNRSDKRPKLGDIYGSAEPEYVTDNLLYVYRPDVWEADPKEHINSLHVGYWKCRKKRRDLPASCEFLLDRYGQVRDLSRQKAPEGYWMD